MPLAVTLHNDPGCPWGYSAWPDLTVLRWRYGAGLDWRLVLIGLAETNERYVRAGYTPARMASNVLFRRRFGMPFGTAPRARVLGTGRACRTIVAVRRTQPDQEWAALRALQFGWFTSDLVLDEDEGIATALRAGAPSVDVAAVMALLDDPEVEADYQRDREEARSAAGSPTEAQGKAANTDGEVRYTAPSLVVRTEDGRQLEAGGFQSLEAYDVLFANLDPTLPRRGVATDVVEAVGAFDHGLTTAEVAALMTPGLAERDLEAAEVALLAAAADGALTRTPVGHDAVWRVR